MTKTPPASEPEFVDLLGKTARSYLTALNSIFESAKGRTLISDPVKVRIDKAQKNLNKALENLSTVKQTANPRSWNTIWGVASNALIYIHKVSSETMPPEMTEKYLAAIETDVRILEALYHSTPRKWRHIIAEQSKSSPLAYSAETRWQRYGNVMITSAVSATVTAIVTALILHFI